jgi:Zn-dependent protease
MEDPRRAYYPKSPRYIDYPDDQIDPNLFQINEISRLKPIIEKYFQIYDIQWNEKTVKFHITYYKDNFENNFENLRMSLRVQGFLPKIAFENGEHIIYIIHSPPIKERKIMVNVILFILTIFTTTWAGAILWYGRINVSDSAINIIDPIFNAECALFGFLSFALPLMVILGTHETAHYLAAKRHNIDASLPYFIPLPPPFILGTMGAFISMREPISNKKALMDIGAAGPIAGFLVSLPILVIGFTLETLYPVTLTEISSNVFVFNEPLLFTGIRFFFPASPENSLMHPTAFAGWVGLFVTALNLIPGGQLDGGHIARALLGNKAKYLSFIVILVLFLLSFITGFYLWVFFAFLIMILGTSHPPPLNDISSLGKKRQVVGAFCMAMLLLCIHYAPISELDVPSYELEFELENAEQTILIGGTVTYELKVINVGDEPGDVTIYSPEINYSNSNSTSWQSNIQVLSSRNRPIQETDKFELKNDDHFLLRLIISASNNATYQETVTHDITIKISGMNSLTKIQTFTTRVGSLDINYTLDSVKPIPPGYGGRVKLHVKNLRNQNDTIDFNINFTPPNNNIGWNASITPNTLQLGPLGHGYINISLETPYSARPGTRVLIELRGISRTEPKSIDTVSINFEINR